jgi:hypothetical protein
MKPNVAIIVLLSLAMLFLALFVILSLPKQPSQILSIHDTDLQSTEQANIVSEQDAVKALLKERERQNETTWAQEVDAQKHEQTIVEYWDQMLYPDDDKFSVLAKIPFETLTLDTLGEAQKLDWGIRKSQSAGKGKTLDQKGWREFLKKAENSGYIIDNIEFHQSSFEAPPNELPVSVFDTTLQVRQESTSLRWVLNTDLRVEWTDRLDEDGLFVPGHISLSDTTLLERQGADVFDHQILLPETRGNGQILVFDINGDTHSDILLPSNNLILINNGDGTFESQELFVAPEISMPKSVFTAILADFDNDGHVDLLCTGSYKNTPVSNPTPRQDGLYLFRADEHGRFSTPGQMAAPKLSLTNPQSVTAGDIDADGDLDVWLSQYANPYNYGQMPTPFYDANDGFPSYLLLNNGDGRFEDATQRAGLAPKRFRRTFAASFVDLDDDQDLDLLVSSDFAGTDIYHNDGKGNFTDVSSDILNETSNFGMGHVLSDFNQDGALDFFVIGMASTTMRRLNQMGLFREDHPEFVEMRTRMGYGNRMYLAQHDNTFRQPLFKDSVAHSGWSWGATSLDFDNDGDQDIYVANGHLSGNTTKDYCTQYWCHDIYTGTSTPSKSVFGMFEQTLVGLNTKENSWDGFQKNHLFMNLSNQDFINVAYLMNTAMVEDSRNVISDDFNGDGHPDLLVSSQHQGHPTKGDYNQIHLLTNRWPNDGNWIGVRLQIEPGGPSTIGAVIRVKTKDRLQLAHIVTGDSFRAQHAPMKHFGIGQETSIDSMEVVWPDGATQIINNPKINQYHVLSSSTAQK